MKANNTKQRIINQLRSRFLTGESITCKDFGSEVGSQDIRKAISDLRKDGWQIDDKRIKGSRKKYWVRASQLEELRDRYYYLLKHTEEKKDEGNEIKAV